VRREILISVTLKTTVFWNLMSHGPVEVYWCFRASCYCQASSRTPLNFGILITCYTLSHYRR